MYNKMTLFPVVITTVLVISIIFILTIRVKTYIFKNRCYDKKLFCVNGYVSCFVCDAIARDRMGSVVWEERETQGHWRGRTYL